eukprot:gene3991-33285_t
MPEISLSAKAQAKRNASSLLRSAVLEVVPYDNPDALSASSSRLIEEQTGPQIPMDLHTACACGDYAYVRQQIENGADCNKHNIEAGKANGNDRTTDGIGMTALMWAAACNHESITYFLLQNGVELEAADNKGRTSLVWAAMNGQAAALKLLLGAGANMETVTPGDGRTPLMTAVVNKHELAVQALIDAGAKLESLDKHGETALTLAKRKPCSMVILNLIQVGARKAQKGSSDSALRSEAGLQLGGGSDGSSSVGGGGDGGGGRGGGRGSARVGGRSPEITREPRDSPAIQTMANEGNAGEAQVEEFLTFLGLEKYLSLFQDQEIDFNALVTMDENDLKAIGLKLFGPRRKISSAIKRWQEEQGHEDDVGLGGPED